MQTILGSGGDIGSLLAKEVRKFTNRVRLAARNPKPVNADDELFPTDLLVREQVVNAVRGADVAYLTVGLPYDHRVWQRDWPVIMENVIAACVEENCKLVFFDNVYMYSPEEMGNMIETAGIGPQSEKGKVRALLVEMIQKAIERKGLKALIARSADFYGPGARNGILNVLLISNLQKGSRALWQSDLDKIHSFTYTPDAAKATAILGNDETAYNQVWHLPTSEERLTGRQFIELGARLAGRKAQWILLSKILLFLGGLFSRQIRELREMQYQNDRDYFFNSKKFTFHYNFVPTSYEKGIGESLATKL